MTYSVAENGKVVFECSTFCEASVEFNKRLNSAANRILDEHPDYRSFTAVHDDCVAASIFELVDGCKPRVVYYVRMAIPEVLNDK